jgi:hypothetical protein
MIPDNRRSGRASRGQNAPAVVGPYNGMGECCGDDGAAFRRSVEAGRLRRCAVTGDCVAPIERYVSG